MSTTLSHRAVVYALSVLIVAVATALLWSARGHLNATTIALSLLLVVLLVATLGGSGPALVASALAVLCFNYFFLPPVGTFTVADPQNWIALAVFFITATTVGSLSSAARFRAVVAENRQREIEGLYEQLRVSFARASEAEALRQSEQLKSALLDAVSHDLRTPLTSIKASVTTLLGEHSGQTTVEGLPVELDRAARGEMLEIINEETDRLNRFIEGLIELARIEAGELRLRRRWGAVDEIVAAALARAAALTRSHHVSINVERELPAVRVDGRAVGEVIYTLLDNAAKYAPSGTAISVNARRADDDMIEIAVEDQGAGVPVELRGRVFDKFYQATRIGDAGGHRQPPGTGMGLAIAKGIVEAHDGRIWIEDAASGNGARFVFTLPVGDADEAEMEQRPATDDQPAPVTP